MEVLRSIIRLWLLSLTIFLSIGAAETSAELEEYQIKAAFLFNFSRYVEWPSTSFASADDPIRICVVGLNPFRSSLEAAARGKTVQNRPVVVELATDCERLHQCHIVFVPNEAGRRTKSLLAELKEESILTVGESEEFLSVGGLIAFKVIGSRVRFQIAGAAAERVKLRISSKLLSLAHPVNQ